VAVTEQRINHQFAYQMQALADMHYRHAKIVQVVLDNLSPILPPPFKRRQTTPDP